MRWVLYTGKGGVGKTTTAAAAAALSARRGARVLVASADAAHSLGDVLAERLGPAPRELEPNLWAAELDARFESARHWGRIQDYAARLFAHRGADAALAHELATLPGAEELAALLAARRFAATGRFDLLILDCAPTDAALRLVTLPDVARSTLRTLLRALKGLSAAAAPAARRWVEVPLPDSNVFAEAEALVFRELAGLHAQLTSATTSVRLVLTPERMVIDEARRALTELTLFEVGCDAVVMNRMLPETAANESFFREWAGIEAERRAEVEADFAPLPLLTAPLQPDEVLGLEALARHGRALFGERDPAARFCDPVGIRFERTGSARSGHLGLVGAHSAARGGTGRAGCGEARRRPGDHDCRPAARAQAAAPLRLALAARRAARVRHAARRVPAHRTGNALMRVLLFVGKRRRGQDERGPGHGAARGAARPALLRTLHRRGSQPGRRAGRAGGSAPDPDRGEPVGPGGRAARRARALLGRDPRMAGRAPALRRESAGGGAVGDSGLRGAGGAARTGRSGAQRALRPVCGGLRPHRLGPAHAASARRVAPGDRRTLGRVTGARPAGCGPWPKGSAPVDWIAPDAVFDAAERLASEVEGVRRILLDTARTRARLVLNPARVVLEESRRAFAYLSLYGVSTDCVVVNRVLPESAGAGYFARWAERGRAELAEIEKAFPVPRLLAPLHPREVRGTRELAALGRELYGDSDPARFLTQRLPLRFAREGRNARLEIDLPTVDPGEVSAAMRGPDLLVNVRDIERRIALPASWTGLSVASAAWRDGALEVRLVPAEPAA